jgi:hypothetical protein
MTKFVMMAVRDTVREIVVPVVVAGFAAWAVVKAAEIAHPKPPEPKTPDPK